jgi:hypothetical protein
MDVPVDDGIALAQAAFFHAQWQGVNTDTDIMRTPDKAHILSAVILWTKIAAFEDLQFCFMGSIVACIIRPEEIANGIVREIEILMDSSAWEDLGNGKSRMDHIVEAHSEMGLIDGRNVLKLDDRAGIVLTFRCAGDEYGLPSKLVPPPGSSFPPATAEYLRLWPNGNYYRIPFPNCDVPVPILHFRELLIDIFYRWTANPIGNDWGDVYESVLVTDYVVPLFLLCAIEKMEDGFTAEDAAWIQPKVKELLRKRQPPAAGVEYLRWQGMGIYVL